MSEKIVFNGREYDGIDAMPAEVRRQYEAVLTIVRGQPGGRGMLAALLLSGPVRKLLKITTPVQPRIVVNGKEFTSVDEMPADVRASYERAVAEVGGGSKAAADRVESPPTAFRPPPLLAEDDRRGRLRRIVTWVAIALLVAFWLFRKSIPGQ